MKVFRRRNLLVGVGIALLAMTLSFVVREPFDSMEHGLLYVRYHVRGESKVDSSVLIVYFNEDEIRALGGMPLKRSYYALIISALHNLGAKAIGVDIAFAEANTEFPEYDDVLISVLRSSPNTVLGGYFKSFDSSQRDGQDETSVDTALQRVAYHLPLQPDVPEGVDLVMPFPGLFSAAQHLGHTNFDRDFHIPLFVKYRSLLVPSLSFELFRLSNNTDRTAVEVSAEIIRVKNSGGTTSIPLKARNVMPLNYPGGVDALNTLSALQLLKAYDEASRGEKSSRALAMIRDRIVLLGVIAEGRSSFVPTPYAPQFPAIGMHAVALSNMLQHRFLKEPPAAFGITISLVVGFLGITGAQLRKQGLALVIVGIVLYIVGSLIAFSMFGWVLPMARPLFVLLATASVSLFMRHQAVRQNLASLEREKESLAVQVREKELHLTMLEQELFTSKHGDQRDNTVLLEEIRKYKREIQRLSSQVTDLQAFEFPSAEDADRVQLFEGIIYHGNGPMRGIVDFVRKIAGNDAAVLILGESGTGKELIARAIHRQSNRHDRPFVAVNCGALSETLLESELFGHEKGAFTGAHREKQGRFELANGGSMFLDEIGETSDAFQIKLLRVLQEGEFERVGGTQTLRVNVRILTATNRDLKKAVADRKFREDLYYRLNTLTIQLPPLRERIDDVPILVHHFASMEEPTMRVSTNVMQSLHKYDWKGNVRELQSAMKRAVILARSDNRDIIRLRDLPEEIVVATQDAVDIEDQILELLREKEFSRSAISETAAELGGLNRGTVAEYFRGYCFKMFCENGFDVKATVNAIVQRSDQHVGDRVQRKVLEYLSNAVESVKRSDSVDQALQSSRPKFKNLPQRYHKHLEELLRSYHRGLWHADRIA